MMSSDDHHHMPVKPAVKDNETPGSSTRKTSSSAKPQSEQQQQQQQQQPALKCPRCDSPNTKFCYYNNYSLTQPRHFCKTCRRYWTKGGALRNVPIGGGCRKNKKLKSSSRLSGSDSRDYSGSSSDNLSGGLKFFQGISPAMDFQLGGAALSLPRLNTNPSLPTGIYNNQFSSFGDLNSATSLDPSVAAGTSSTFLGFNYPLTLSSGGGGGGGGGSGGGCGFSGGVLQNMNVHSNLASSIESLSSINQDLHWKLQQQRLQAMLLGTTAEHDDPDQSQKGNTVISSSLQLDHHQDQQQPIKPILFQNLEISSKPGGAGVVGARAKEAGGDMATEWFFGNSYAPPPVTDPTPTNSGGGGNGGGFHQNASNAWNGVHQAWSDLQYNALP